MSPRLSLVLAALLVGTGCKPPEEDAPPPVPTFEVTRSDSFVRRVTAEGYLAAVEATSLNAPEDTQRPLKVAWVQLDGSQVQEGQVVVRFDASQMERELQDSQDDVTAAEREISRERVLGAKGKRNRDRAADLARAQVDSARDLQTEDENILSRNEIIESRIDIDLAQAKVDHAHTVKGIEGSVSHSQVQVHEITRRQAENEVERAKDGLQRLEIAAPHAGILVLERDWNGNPLRVGDTIWRGQKVAEIPLVTEMQAELFVLEADAGDLAEGLPAELVVEAHPDRTYQAKISKVDALAKPRHQEVPVQYFGVTLSLEQTDEAVMKVGQRVRATIILEQGESIVVPRQAVFDEDGKMFVYRQDGSEFEEVEVELGPSSAGRVVVLEGLSEGDHIALRDPSRKASELLEGEGEAKEGGEAKAPGGPVQ